MDGPAIQGPLGVGELLDRAFRLFRHRLWKLLLAAAIFLAPLGVVSGLLIGGFATSYFDLLGSASSRRAGSAAFDQILFGTLGYYGALTVVVLLSVPVNGLATLTVTLLNDEALRGRPSALVASIRRAVRRLPAYILMQILQGLAVLGIMLLVLIPFAILVAIAIAATGLASGGGRPNPIATAGIVILVLVGYLAALILIALPAVYLATRWLVAGPVLLLEGAGPVGALGRSWRLTKGNVWRCIGFYLLLIVLGLLLGWLPLMLVQQVLIVVAGPANMGWVTGFSSGLGQIGAILWLPLQSAATVLLYYDLRVRAEGYDLAQRISAMEAETAALPNRQPPPAAVETAERPGLTLVDR